MLRDKFAVNRNRRPEYSSDIDKALLFEDLDKAVNSAFVENEIVIQVKEF